MKDAVIADYIAITQLIARFALAFDLKDWLMLRNCLTDEIETDYSDFRGELPTRVRADSYVARREASLAEVKTQHLTANLVIEVQGDDTATCTFDMVIYRYRPALETDNTYTTHAVYTDTLTRTDQGWKICKIKQSVLWNEGNPLVHGKNR